MLTRDTLRLCIVFAVAAGILALFLLGVGYLPLVAVPSTTEGSK